MGQTGLLLHRADSVSTPGRLQGVRCAAQEQHLAAAAGDIALWGSTCSWLVLTDDPSAASGGWTGSESSAVPLACAYVSASRPCRRQKEFMAALRWLDWLLRERGNEPELWARVMYVQLGIGDVSAAEQTILRLAALLQVGAPATVLGCCVALAMACTAGPARLTACL